MIVLKSFETEQELFDYVCNKIITQNCKSTNYVGESLYIKDRETNSPIGWLMVSENPKFLNHNNYVFSIDIEHNSLDELIKSNKIEKPEFLSLIRQLENCHDKGKNMVEIVCKFYKTALLYGLHTKNLKEMK